MEVLFLLLPLALGFMLATIVVFRWAVGAGQFDDLETPALRMLLDADSAPSTDAQRKS
jgi:cbb3-type cytochrome oxidase maturation protein